MNVRCPRCSWAPSDDARWECAACETRYDPFAEAACCPGCLWTLNETRCLECGQWSAHWEWFVDEAEREAFLANYPSDPPLWSAKTMAYAWRVVSKVVVLDVNQLPNASRIARGEKEPPPELGELRGAVLDAEERVATLVGKPELADDLRAARDSLEEARAALREAARAVAAARCDVEEEPAPESEHEEDEPLSFSTRSLARLADRALSSTRAAYERVAGDCGESRVAAGDYRGAIAECDRVLVRDPDNADAWWHRGRANVLLGNNRAAIPDLDEVIRLNAEHYGAHYLLAYAALASDDYERAITSATRAFQVAKAATGDLYAVRAEARCMDQCDLEAALYDAKQAISLDPDTHRHRVVHARILRLLGDLDAAFREYDAVLERDPFDCGALCERGFAILDADVAHAEAAANRALRLEPEDPYAYGLRAHARIARGDLGGAIRDAARARAGYERADHGRSLLGLLAAHVGLTDAARAHFRAAFGPRDSTHPRMWLRTLGLDPAALDGHEPETPWKAALAALARGERTPADVLTLANESSAPGVRAERRTVVFGLQGVLAQQAGDDPWEHYQACVAEGVTFFFHWAWATLQLHEREGRLSPPSAAEVALLHEVAPSPLPLWGVRVKEAPRAGSATGEHEPELQPAPQPEPPGEEPPASPANQAGDFVSQLERLAELKTKGLLSDEEFSALKRKLLG